MRPHKTPKAMASAKEDAFDAILLLREQWATDSNNETAQGKLFAMGELFISNLDTELANGGGHPSTPPPRIRP